MPGETLSVLLTAEDRASSKFRDVGRAAADSSVKMDLAAASQKLWNDTSAKSAKATDTLVASKLAAVKADTLLQKAESFVSAEADKASKTHAVLAGELENTAAAAGKAAAATGAAAGTGGIPGGGMGALIGAGVALSPVLVTTGFGLAGLAAAAYGVVKPIETAAQKAGGLSANLNALDAEQRTVAVGILGLGKEFGSFQNSLKPEVLGIFNQGIRIAGHLLHDVEPVAAATGKALGGVLASIDREFQSGTWQQFFAFMARTAGPDVQLLGKNLTDLTATLPPLLEQLQPTAVALLSITDAAVRLVGAAATANNGLDSTGQHMNILEKATTTLRTVLFSPGAGLLAALKLLHIAGNDAGTGLGSAGTGMQHFQQVTIGTLPAMTGLVNKTISTAAPMDRLGKVAATTSMTIQETGRNAYLAIDPMSRLGKAADILVGAQTGLASSGRATASAAAAVAAAWKPVLDGTRTLTTSVAALNTQMTTLVGNLLTLQGSDLSWKQSLQAAETQLKSNSAGLEGNSKNALANKQAILASTSAAIQFASQQLTLGRNIGQASNTIQSQIKFLQGLHDKSAFVRSELAALRAEEARLNAQRINQTVSVNGIGRWSVAGPGGSFRSGRALAAGGRVPGAGNSDSYPALLTPGEVVVPRPMVSAGAVDHLRGSLPGFAAGGIVPKYSGAVAGLSPWIKGNDQATIRLIDQAVASATIAGIKAARTAALAVGRPGGHGAIGGGVQQWANLVLVVLKMLGQPAGDLGTVLSQMTTESGGNPRAINLTDINAQQGDPSRGLMQVIGTTFSAYAGQFRNRGIYDPLANIYAGLNYAIHRYGSGWTSVLGHGHGYDSGGYLPTGLSLAYNGTGRPEMVIPNRGGGGAAGGEGASMARVESLLQQLIMETRAAPQRTGGALGDALNGRARTARYSGMYSARGA